MKPRTRLECYLCEVESVALAFTINLPLERLIVLANGSILGEQPKTSDDRRCSAGECPGQWCLEEVFGHGSFCFDL